MKILRSVLRVRSPRRGVALVIALAFIVLITIIVVSYLATMRLDRQSTLNYSQSIRAQELAYGAFEEILWDLRKEIDAGSLQGTNYVVNGRRIFVPVSPLTSQPARIGFSSTNFATDVGANKLPPSFVRASRAGDDFFSSPPAGYNASLLPPDRASAVGTDQRSANGKTFPSHRWNKPLLMGTNAPSVFTNRPPEWIYVTRSGGRSLTDVDLDKLKVSPDIENPDQVLGRYAYVIYDQGGLLDVNVAGYLLSPSGSAPAAEEIRGKSMLAYADLTQLPGLSGKQAEVDELVNWRSKGALASTNYGNGKFADMVKKLMPEGFLKFQAGDSPLLGRQDLIDYFQKKVGTLQPLAYLTTFSRAVNAPSWRPQTPAGSSVDYAAEAEKPASANRNLANVRFKAGGTVTHYDDDAQPLTYTVEEGDPLMQSRFSLARLAWLEQADPDAGSGPAETSNIGRAIKACFGLVWDYPGGNGGTTAANGGNRCWNYVGAAGSLANPPGRIKTLEEVADEGREPDFFELLKAAILSGSLGRHPGEAAFDNGRDVNYRGKGYSGYSSWAYEGAGKTIAGPAGLYAYSLDLAGTVPSPARMSDVQIIQIGANIIDQADEDSYPSAIYFKYQGVGTYDPALDTGHPILGPVTMVYGIENLPYLMSMIQLNCSPDRSGSGTPTNDSDDATTSLAGWRQPQIWNPHKRPSSALAKAPRNFQIRAYGSAQTYWATEVSNGTPAPGSWPPGLYDGGHRRQGASHIVNYFTTNSSAETSGVGTLTFTDASDTSSFYARPFLLTTDIPGVTADSPANTRAQPPGGDNVAKPHYPYYDSISDSTYNPYANPFVAFATGETVPPGPGVPNLVDIYQPFWVSQAVWRDASSNGVDTTGFGAANTYALGWVDGSGRFHPYSFITGAFPHDYTSLQRAIGTMDRRVGTVQPDRVSRSTWVLPDPRTARFSLNFKKFSNDPRGNNSIFPRNGVAWALGFNPRTGEGFGYSGTVYQRDWLVNASTSIHGASFKSTWYADPDGVIRPGDGIFSDPARGDGVMLFSSNASPTGGSYADGDSGGNVSHGRRPVILNRLFRSLGELGYVFRDQPFKTLDFFTRSSADSALLEVFGLADNFRVANARLRSVTAGRINPNNAPYPVLQAVLAGGAKKESDPAYNLTPAQASTIAGNLANILNPASGPAPVADRAGFALALASEPATGSGAVRDVFGNSPDKGNKAYLEAPLRALADVGNMRTWNLLIDVVAQSGKISPNASGLNDFMVEGERRYWLHVAIDRFSGEIIDRQLEPVYE